MKAQFKYSFRASLTLRSVAVGATLIMNIVFGLLGYFDVYGHGGKVTAVTLCSIALCGILGICFATDFYLIHSMCSAPAGYLLGLTPVKSWRIILSRVVTILVEDMICLVIAISGVFVQALIESGSRMPLPGDKYSLGTLLWLAVIFILGYIYATMIILLGAVLAKSVFYGMRVGTFLAVLATTAVAYVFSLLDFILMPFGAVENWNIFYSISLVIGPNPGFLAYIMLNVCRIAALFIASSYLMERKINI